MQPGGLQPLFYFFAKLCTLVEKQATSTRLRPRVPSREIGWNSHMTTRTDVVLGEVPHKLVMGDLTIPWRGKGAR